MRPIQRFVISNKESLELLITWDNQEEQYPARYGKKV